MKKILLTLFLLVFTGAFAQQLEYIFSHSSTTYTDLSAPTDITTDAWTSKYVMRLPFTFKYFDKGYDTIHISAASGIYFSNIPGSSDIISFGQKGYFPENNMKSQSPVSYLVSGTTPNRIMKIQFKNFRATNAHIVTNQIWLYETGNKFEYHFGPNQTGIQLDEFYIGYIDVDNSPYYAIDSSAANPVLTRVTQAGLFNGISSHPLEGEVYTMTPRTSVSIDQLIKPYMFNQLVNGFQLNSEKPASIGVYDLSGKLVETIPYAEGQLLRHEFTDIAPGIYLVNILVNNAQFIEKIVVR